ALRLPPCRVGSRKIHCRIVAGRHPAVRIPEPSVCSQSLSHATSTLRNPAARYCCVPPTWKPSPPPPLKCTTVPRSVPVGGRTATTASIGSPVMPGQPVTVTCLQVEPDGAPCGQLARLRTLVTVPRPEAATTASPSAVASSSG